jgi:co-chaperonin GroES (HSP10)
MYDPIQVTQLRALRDDVIVADMHFSERITTGGIVLRSDNSRTEGIRPRWGRVYAIGEDQRDVVVGQYVLVAHGRWTRGVDIVDAQGVKSTVRRVDINDILCVSDEPINDDYVNNGI